MAHVRAIAPVHLEPVPYDLSLLVGAPPDVPLSLLRRGFVRGGFVRRGFER